MAIAFTNSIHPELIAPCGMNCAVCSRYLAFVNKISTRKGIVYCKGCRPDDRLCAMIKKPCRELLDQQDGEVEFCCDCDKYPCEKLSKLDRRYRENYDMSMIENLERIRTVGLAQFISEQCEKYRCDRCGGFKSVHNKKCFRCEKIIGWKK